MDKNSKKESTRLINNNENESNNGTIATKEEDEKDVSNNSSVDDERQELNTKNTNTKGTLEIESKVVSNVTNLNDVFAQLDNNDDKIEEKMNQLINQYQVLVVSKTHCPFCLETKRTLNELGIPFGVIEINLLKSGSSIQSQLTKMTNQKTVPHIWIDGKHIGGCNDFKTYIKQGKLANIINQHRGNSDHYNGDNGDDDENGDQIEEYEHELYSSNCNTIKYGNDKNVAFECLFSFPSSVNNYTVRGLGIMAMIICIFGLIYRNKELMHWIICGLFIDYTIRFFSGASMSPMGILSNIIVSFFKKPKFSPGPPKQFASLCGMIFSGLTFLFFRLDEIEIGCVIISILLLCAAMEGIFDFCVGCFVFSFLVQFKIVSPTVYKLHLNTKDEKELIYDEAFTKLNQGPYVMKQRFIDPNNPRKCDLYYKIKSDEQKQEDFHIIRHLRISLFFLVLGVTALSIVWRFMADINNDEFTNDIWNNDIERTVSDILFVCSLVLFGIMIICYLLRLIFYTKKCIKEFQHPTTINIFAAIPLNIICYCYLAYDRDYGPNLFYKTIFWICAFCLLLLMIHITQIWFQRRLTLEDIDPMWLIPSIANFATVFVGVGLDNDYWDELWLWFSSGILLLAILFPITFYKIIVNANSDDRRRNNMLIWCAAPAFAGLAYDALNEQAQEGEEGDINYFSLCMYWSSIFMALVIGQLMITKFIGRAKFTESYYSFGFSFCGVALAAIQLNNYVNMDKPDKFGNEMYNVIGYIFIIIASFAVGINLLHTLYALVQKRILRPVIPKWGVLSFMRLTHEAFRGWMIHINQLLDQSNNGENLNIAQITAEWNVVNIIHKEHARHEDEVIFKEAKTLFPQFTDVADQEHVEHEVMTEKINKMLKDANNKPGSNELNQEIVKAIKNYCDELNKHLLWEEANIQPILRKYIPLELQKKLVEKVWSVTDYTQWSILIPWILRNQRKLPQRVLFLKTLIWAMPYRCQMIGLIVYRGCNDVLWADIAQELPEIVPRGVTGWRRQY